ncbi:hypothetical protein DFH06DRAFT_1471510 [Mycena polygramma]|nr:hypothetical protein DFH06DRAFT_1471510 [Mycena polygramma]
MRARWFLFHAVNVLLAAAGQTNHSIDDASGLVRYDVPPKSVACPTLAGLDVSKLHDGTCSFISAIGLTFDFNGSALYVFVASSPIDSAELEFSLDGSSTSGSASIEPALPDAKYNVSVYTGTFEDGPHTFRMNVLSGSAMFDYALYTSNDADPISSSTRKKPPVGAIAGAVVGAVALIFILLVAVIFVRRARHNKWRNTPAMQESRLSTDTLKEPLTVGSSVSDTMPSGAIQDDVRVLREELQQLRQQVQGSSTPGDSEAASLGRSISTMKREQTRALQQQGPGSNVTDSLVHTDSGLRLTASRREVDELPPSYVAD